MQLGALQTFVLRKNEKELTLECQIGDLDEKILGSWILMGVITISMGFTILLGLAHLPDNAPRGVGIMPLSFGCLALGASLYKARLASTVTFDLKQKFVTITPMWHWGRKQTYRFDEIQSLHAIKHFVRPYSFIGRRWWYDYWQFSFVLRNKKKLTLGEGYPPGRRDEYIQIYGDTIVIAHPIAGEAVSGLECAARAARMASMAVRPLRRPVATMEQISA